MTVDEVMTTELLMVDVDDGIFERSRTIAENHVRRLPAVDQGELVGIVTQDDLIVVLSEEMGNLARAVEAESPPLEWDRAY